MREVIAGIDIGGTKTAVALGSLDGEFISARRLPTRVELGPQRILDNTLRAIEGLAEEERATLVAAGIGCAGPLDIERGFVMSPPNLPGWDQFPIVGVVKERLDVPVLLDNDANAAALGEHRYGAGRGFDNIVYITISTGIGGGIIVGGKLIHGVGAGAGEVGHITVLPDGPQCGCGARGCMEALCSGTGIARRAQERLRAGAQSRMTSMVARLEDVTAREVAAAADQGDRLAREIWGETIRYLAVGIGNVMVTIAPEVIILGGGVSTAGEQLLTPLRASLRGQVKIVPAERIRIMQAALGDQSGIYGALVLGRSAFAAR